MDLINLKMKNHPPSTAKINRHLNRELKRVWDLQVPASRIDHLIFVTAVNLRQFAVYIIAKWTQSLFNYFLIGEASAKAKTIPFGP